MKNLIYYRYGLQNKGFALPLTSIYIVFILLFLLVLLISCSLFHNAFAASPAFDQIFITDVQMGKNDWVHQSNYARARSAIQVDRGLKVF